MKRRMITLALAAAMLLGILPAGAQAQGGFVPARSYTGQFGDISPSDWYYEAVKSLYELGLTEGKGAGDRFDPGGQVTVAEIVTMAARLRSLWETGDSEAGPEACTAPGAWYQPYAVYLQQAGAIGGELEGAYARPATRAEMAHVLSGALPGEMFTPLNGELVASAWTSGQYIRDVTPETAYSGDILQLYTWGITAGSDDAGAFQPETEISRAQAAAMVARMAFGEQRLVLDWEVRPAYSKVGVTLADLVASDGSFYNAPAPGETAKIDADVRLMLSKGERDIELSYPADVLNRAYADALTQAFLDAARNYVEQSYNYIKVSYSTRAGYMKLTFGSSLYPEDRVDFYREETLKYALAVHDQMWESGRVTSDMTEYDKARVYFTWVCENCRYDHASTPMSHTGWRLFAEQIAVCDGYTAAYNLLLKLEDIDCGTWSTTDHIWTVAQLDGRTYHIDTTWGDQSYGVEYRCFGMTEAEAIARF